MNVPYRELRLGFETAYIDGNVLFHNYIITSYTN